MIRAKRCTTTTKGKNLTSYVEIKNIISHILFEEDLNNVLEMIARHIEEKLPKAKASILLYDEKTGYLLKGAAPSLDADFWEQVSGYKIGPESGSCGTAAFYRTTVVVRDIQVDRLWKSYADLSKKYNLRACWSMPILNMKGELYGTFALYYSRPHKPNQKEMTLVKELIDIVCLAIEREKSATLKKQADLEIANQRTNAINSLKHVSIGEMAKNISHEVNNPLAVIRGSVQQINRLVSQNNNSEGLKTYVDRLDRSALRIEKIVRGLHLITKETSKDPYIKISMKRIINDALSIFQERILNSDITARVIGDVETEFECRSIQIFQVLVNLLNNSYEAVAKTSNPWIEFKVSNCGNKLKIEITDSGSGIPEDIADKIMIPLFTTKALSNSTGLGLAISQVLIQEHSGNIWYDKSCQHTRFVIELPLEQVSFLKQAA
jgi:C4-dicarboxylate-specific signal transduction histidine kinase